MERRLSRTVDERDMALTRGVSVQALRVRARGDGVVQDGSRSDFLEVDGSYPSVRASGCVLPFLLNERRHQHMRKGEP